MTAPTMDIAPNQIPVWLTTQLAVKSPVIEGDIVKMTAKEVVMKLRTEDSDTPVDSEIEMAHLVDKVINLNIPEFGYFEARIISLFKDIAVIHFTENHKVIVNLILDKYGVN